MMADNWERMDSWNLVLPPSRPSQAELSRIAAVVQDLRGKPRVGILGSTPEYRDLVYELGISDVCILERNISFYHHTQELRVHENHEELVEGDWLDTLPRMSGAFDVILSDLTSGNVPYADRPHFYGMIEDALAPGGVFLDKVLTHPGPLLQVHELLDSYSTWPLNWATINRFSCEVFFCSELLEADELVDTSRFYDQLEGQVRSRRLEHFIRLTRTITPPGCVWYYGRPWKALSPQYCPRLKVVGCFPDDPTSPYFGRLQHFVHAKEG